MKPRKSPGERTAGQFDRTHEAATRIYLAFAVTAEISFFAGTVGEVTAIPAKFVVYFGVLLGTMRYARLLLWESVSRGFKRLGDLNAVPTVHRFPEYAEVVILS